MNQRSMFDATPHGFQLKEEDRRSAPSENGQGNFPGSELPSSGVARVIEHWRGPFTRTFEGSVVATFQLHVFDDGTIWEAHLTGDLAGQLAPSGVFALEWIEECVRKGLWREVPHE